MFVDVLKRYLLIVWNFFFGQGSSTESIKDNESYLKDQLERSGDDVKQCVETENVEDVTVVNDEDDEDFEGITGDEIEGEEDDYEEEEEEDKDELAEDVAVPKIPEVFKPDVDIKKPEVPKPKEDVEVKKPEVPKPKEDVEVKKPEVSKPKEDVEVKKPEVSKPKEDVEDKKPEVPKPKEDVTIPEKPVSHVVKDDTAKEDDKKSSSSSSERVDVKVPEPKAPETVLQPTVAGGSLPAAPETTRAPLPDLGGKTARHEANADFVVLEKGESQPDKVTVDKPKTEVKKTEVIDAFLLEEQRNGHPTESIQDQQLDYSDSGEELSDDDIEIDYDDDDDEEVEEVKPLPPVARSVYKKND